MACRLSASPVPCRSDIPGCRKASIGAVFPAVCESNSSRPIPTAGCGRAGRSGLCGVIPTPRSKCQQPVPVRQAKLAFDQRAHPFDGPGFSPAASFCRIALTTANVSSTLWPVLFSNSVRSSVSAACGAPPLITRSSAPRTGADPKSSTENATASPSSAFIVLRTQDVLHSAGASQSPLRSC